MTEEPAISDDPTPLMEIIDAHGPIFTVHHDGRVTLDQPDKADTAARRFVEELTALLSAEIAARSAAAGSTWHKRASLIPVRVPHDAALHIVRDDVQLEHDHPLHGAPCPACALPLQAGQTLSLVYVGVESDMRKEHGFMTGAAVAVHSTCSGRSVANV